MQTWIRHEPLITLIFYQEWKSPHWSIAFWCFPNEKISYLWEMNSFLCKPIVWRHQYVALLYSWHFSRYSALNHWLVHCHMTSNNETVSRQMPWAGNIAKTMTSNRKQFPATHEMLTAVARHLSIAWLFVFHRLTHLLYYITNHLMTGPLGNSEFCFPWISMFPSTSSRETLRFSGNKIHCSPRDQSLSV